MAADLSLFTIEMYTPGEIVEARRSFSAETATAALRAAMGWINDGGHDATSVRIVDTVGTILFVAVLANNAKDRLPGGNHRVFSASVRNEEGLVIFTASLTLKSGWA